MHWKKLFTLFDKNPEWEDFLTDMGSDTAPTKYLVAVEEGLRSFGNDQPAFGKFAMDSLQEWLSVSRFKKRECFIAMARHRLGLGGYAKYRHFKWSDYVSRGKMTKTFDERHWPLTNGTQVLKELSNPWATLVDRRHQRKKFNRAKKVHVKQVTNKPEAAAAAGSIEYDSEEFEFVDVEEELE